jgi:hypothetical protein
MDVIFPQTDENTAAVLTYVRNSFGNSASAVTPDMVAALRPEAGKGILSVADLLPPIAEVSDAPTGPLAEIPSSGLGASGTGILTLLVIVGLSVFALIRMKLTSK